MRRAPDAVGCPAHLSPLWLAMEAAQTPWGHQEGNAAERGLDWKLREAFSSGLRRLPCPQATSLIVQDSH